MDIFSHEKPFVIQVNTVVSGALDRLHYEKDPCVKYDIGRKLWIYLHRSRSQEEFGNQLCSFSHEHLLSCGFVSHNLYKNMTSLGLTKLILWCVVKLIAALVDFSFPFFLPERIHQAQAAAAKARKALQQKPKPSSKPVSLLLWVL